jgi:anaerobic ribonucleoside-triphosphate reductase
MKYDKRVDLYGSSNMKDDVYIVNGHWWDYTYKCDNGHVWKAVYGEICPICMKQYSEKYRRIIGYIHNPDNFTSERKSRLG